MWLSVPQLIVFPSISPRIAAMVPNTVPTTRAIQRLPVVRYAQTETGVSENEQEKSEEEGQESGSAYFEVRTSEFGKAVGRIDLAGVSSGWNDFETVCECEEGTSSVYLVYYGKDRVQLRDLFFR